MPTRPKLLKAMKFFATWSYSKLVDWLRCPLFARLKHLEKMGDRQNDAMDRGNEIHEKAQVWVVAKQDKPLPKELTNFRQEFKELRKHKRDVMVEQQWAFDEKWNQTAWFESDAAKQKKPMPWGRVVLDAVLPIPKNKHVRVIDYKTGKQKDEHLPQLELYAIAAFVMFPWATTVTAELWYLDHGVDEKPVFERAELPALKKKWSKKLLPMIRDRQFRPVPGKYCSWCPFRKSNGGPCQY